MAFNKKLTWVRGQRRESIAIAAGSAIGAHDAIEVNIDATAMTRFEAAKAMTLIRDRIMKGPWPVA
jgi:hypothetical protein